MIVMGDLSMIRAGQAIEAAGQIATIAPPLNPGEFDYRGFLQAQGIRLRFTVDDPASFWPDPGGTNRPFTLWLDNHRHRIRTWLFEQLDPSNAPLAAALLLGWREEIDPEVNDAFARTGTTHLLAVSGLQLQALAAALLLIFRAVGLPRRPAYAIVGLTMIGYALLVGPAPSVVRSTVMTYNISARPPSHNDGMRPTNTLSLAGLAHSCHQSDVPVRRGPQLSFLAIESAACLAGVAGPVPLESGAFLEIRSASVVSRSGARCSMISNVCSSLPDGARRCAGWCTSTFDGIVASAVVWLAALPLGCVSSLHLVSPIRGPLEHTADPS